MADSPVKRLVVIGAGAVGGGIGGLVNHAGLPVVLIARGEHGRAIQKDGLCLRLPDQTISVHPPCFESIEHFSDWQPGDVAMLATKLNDAREAMNELLTNAGEQIPVICASNGVQGERWAQERFSHVISMLVWLPATHLVPGEVRLYSGKCRGVLDCGPSRPTSESENSESYQLENLVSNSICSWLRAASFDAVVRDDIKRWKMAKWITNLSNTAQALVTDDWKRVAAFARSEGKSILDHAKIERVSGEELLARCKQVEANSIDGETRLGGSTWQSLQRGKPLESRWLEGAMADLADELGIPAPVNRFLSNASLDPRPLLASDIPGVE